MFFVTGWQLSLKDFYRALPIKGKYWYKEDVARVLNIPLSAVNQISFFQGIENLRFPIFGFSLATAVAEGATTTEEDFFRLPEMITTHLINSMDTSSEPHRHWNLTEVTRHFTTAEVNDPNGPFIRLSQTMHPHQH